MGSCLTYFFTLRCSDFLITKDAVDSLGKNSTLLSKVSVVVSGVGGAQTESNYGMYRIILPLSNGNTASLSGIFLPKIAEELPKYPLEEAERDLLDAAGNLLRALPKSFESDETTGSQITYRCEICQDYEMCKTHDSVEVISLKEEAEQALINSSVKINQETSITSARLPFISNPIQSIGAQ